MGFCAYSYGKNGRTYRKGYEPSSRSNPLTQGEAQTISTYYDRGTIFGSPYKDEALDAEFDSSTGVLKLGYAQDKEWNEGNHSTNKRQYLDITVQNGIINGEPVNLDLSDGSIKEIEAVRLSSKSERTLEKAGFGLNSRTKRWEKDYKGYSTEGSTLYADSALPDNFSGITKIKTKYGAVDTKPIKAAGFKWNGTDKVWEKK